MNNLLINNTNEEFLFDLNTKINKILQSHRNYSILLGELILHKRVDGTLELGKEDIRRLINSNKYYK
jgi:hypothetical protein